MGAGFLHLGLLTRLWQMCVTQGTYAISCQNLRCFFSKVQMRGTGTTPQSALGLLATPPSVLCQCFHVSACPEAGFTAPHQSWSLLSRVLNVLNTTHYPAFIFYTHGLLSKVIRASPWHACTLSAASSARYSCVHTLPQLVLAVL